MATKSYSKHKEYKEYSSSKGNVVPYTDEQFDMIKSELLPKGSKLDSLGRGAGSREYHYEYKEEKHPSGKYDRKDLHTVEEYTIPAQPVPKASESSSYYYEREERELPVLNGSSGARTYNYETVSSSTPGYSRVKSSKVTKDLSHNVEELDSLLDDLQKDQERQLYRSGYTSDTAESSSFDYRRGTPLKAPSSGYSTLKRSEQVESSSWGSSPPPVARATELRQEMFREEKTESRVVPSQVSPAAPLAVPPAVCNHCHHATSTLSRSSTPMNKVTTTVKTYTYEVPADQDPARAPIPPSAETHTYHVNENLLTSTTTNTAPAPSPALGCQYCSHCNSRVREYRHVTTSDEHTNERMVYPAPANETKLIPASTLPQNGHGPYGPTSYKYSETTYSSHNSTQRYPGSQASPAAPFPRPVTPSPGNQQPPKKLDDLLADFPEARFPTDTEGGVRQRQVEVTQARAAASPGPASPGRASRNVAGPAVYYPPGHTPFQKAEGYQASAMQGGGAYASGRGMYEYEAGARSKEKHSEKKTAVPICLPLCCAMPCVIL
ncbi:uncharacterized protein LOC106139651 [Amyelois transitella]|uniref:uncharacterized protein LOC106139651 n=1 Tax=Amyelois transitella TaxID=680683 RepID=UPI00067C30A3|nr:uncharacterized protein LOC106139651 [Amyelois transitella]XP_013196588.1 uncharacterized protein LOC106139651 [Amyelois transitella]